MGPAGLIFFIFCRPNECIFFNGAYNIICCYDGVKQEYVLSNIRIISYGICIV